MKTVHRNDEFTCSVCEYKVPPATATCRNHCIMCLSSLHVDVVPGDRKSTCHGVLTPIFAEYHAKKGYMINFRCKKCGYNGRNKASDQDNQELLCQLVLAANQKTAGLRT